MVDSGSTTMHLSYTKDREQTLICSKSPAALVTFADGIDGAPSVCIEIASILVHGTVLQGWR
jgi:hypothetical protein